MNQKSTSCDTPPPGFRGLDPHVPVRIYRRHLPHWRQDGATYFVTFRLADSLPKAAVKEMQAEREAWLNAHGRSGFPSRPTTRVGRDKNPDQHGVGRDSNPDPRTPGESRPTSEEYLEYERRAFAALERWLHTGHGACVLAEAESRRHLRETMKFFEGVRYELCAFVIMPNHVHAVVKPLPAVGRDSNPDLHADRDSHPDLPCYELESILGSWKRRSARCINEDSGKSNPVWQAENYDRIVRDTAELRRTIHYMAKNPGQAHVDGEFWLREDWRGWWNVGRDANPDPRWRVGRDANPDLQNYDLRRAS